MEGMTLVKPFVVARSASGRATLMHRIGNVELMVTACGLDINVWSRAYLSEKIPQIMCKRCEGDAR